MIKDLFNDNWKPYLISITIVSIGAFFIHAKKYQPLQLNTFFMWLPVSWLLVFVLMCGFYIFLGDKQW